MTTLVVTYLVPAVWYPRTSVLVGGGWGLLPGAHWVSPIGTAWLHHIHQTSVWVDIFWFYRTLDRLDPVDSKVIASVILTFFIVVTLLAECRGDRAPAVVIDSYESPMETPTSDDV